MTDKLIIGLCGLAGCGKSFIADWLTTKFGIPSIAFADPIKRIAKDIFNFTDEQLWGPSHERNKPDKRYWRLSVDRETLERRAEEYADLRSVVMNDYIDNPIGHSSNLPPMEVALGLSKEELEIYKETGGYLTPRFACQNLGTEYGRSCYKNIWIDYAFRTADSLLDGFEFQTAVVYGSTPKIQTCEFSTERRYYGYDCKIGIDKSAVSLNRPRGVTISDVRFRNEFDAIKARGGKVVRIYRDEGTTLTGTGSNHQSEKEQKLIADNEFDYVLHNVKNRQQLSASIEDMMQKIA